MVVRFLNPDGTMLKPVEPRRLAARVKALLARSPAVGPGLGATA